LAVIGFLPDATGEGANGARMKVDRQDRQKTIAIAELRSRFLPTFYPTASAKA
jgi:hypothetical protein